LSLRMRIIPVVLSRTITLSFYLISLGQFAKLTLSEVSAKIYQIAPAIP
jgi:hypothetical protein